MFTYELPSDLIAQQPCEPRDAARLLVLNRATGQIAHQLFRDLPEFLRPGDCLVLNDTRVLPARLLGVKADTGGKVELLLLQPEGESTWRCLGQPGRRLKIGTRLLFNHGSLQGEVLSSQRGARLVRFWSENLQEALATLGQMPLPPYIRREAQQADTIWYQTVYARVPGAVAAPTAGLHFTEDLLARVRRQGIRIAFVTLHVGWGTFKPVGEEELESGRLHGEQFQLSAEAVGTINAAKGSGGRVIAVGTTVVRALETAAREKGILSPAEGTTGLFIQRPFDFRVVDALVTNFHLPGTSLLFLVEAFAGQEKISAAYRAAIDQRYRFYSYGDAMFIH